MGHLDTALSVSSSALLNEKTVSKLAHSRLTRIQGAG